MWYKGHRAENETCLWLAGGLLEPRPPPGWFFPWQMGKDSTRIHHPYTFIIEQTYNENVSCMTHIMQCLTCPPLTNPGLTKSLVANRCKPKTTPRSPLRGILPPPDPPSRVGPHTRGTVLYESIQKEWPQPPKLKPDGPRSNTRTTKDDTTTTTTRWSKGFTNLQGKHLGTCLVEKRDLPNDGTNVRF